MYAGTDFDPIDVNERPVLTFDFAKYPLASGEVVSSVIWSCTVADFSTATDASPATRLLTGPTINGTQTLYQVGTMVAGVKYRLAAQATTSLGQILNLFSFALCQDPALVT
jgi:hypothetical protein